MPYIGNTPADKFLTLAKQSFSTSATTSYTLDNSISSTQDIALFINCLLYTSPSPRDGLLSRMPSSA